MSTPALSIVLPCYNEAENIPHIVARLARLLRGRPDVEVILVNNGSQDDSAAALKRELAAADLPGLRVCDVPVNRGYGFGIMSGIRAARGTFLAWTHADGQTDPADVLAAFDTLRLADDPERTLLKGRRRARPLLDDLFTRGMAAISTVALGAPLFDINAQPKLFHRSFLDDLTAPPDDFALDLYALYQAKRRGYRLIEQDVHFAKRQFGEAKGGGTMKGKVKLIRRTWGYIRQLRAEIRAGVR